MLDSLKKENLHHAYLLVGEFSTRDLSEKIEHFLNVEISGNPDFQVLEFDTLTIDFARNLIESSGRKGLSCGKKIFIIKTNIITEEAQNALLKMFEEPTDGTHFFIMMPQDILLPTLRSRLHILLTPSVSKSKLTVGFGKILEKTLKERFEIVKDITDAISDEDKTKQDAISLLNKIELELYERGIEKISEKLKVCDLTRRALYNRGAPVKMILENLMLNI